MVEVTQQPITNTLETQAQAEGKSTKKKTGKKLTVNLSDASKAEAVLRKIIQLHPEVGWVEEIYKPKATLRWL